MNQMDQNQLMIAFQYHPYIVERDGKTLLPQFLGMYRLTVDNVENYMCVMRNVFSGHLKVSQISALELIDPLGLSRCTRNMT